MLLPQWLPFSWEEQDFSSAIWMEVGCGRLLSKHAGRGRGKYCTKNFELNRKAADSTSEAQPRRRALENCKRKTAGADSFFRAGGF
jgi:hypothetical protein